MNMLERRMPRRQFLKGARTLGLGAAATMAVGSVGLALKSNEEYLESNSYLKRAKQVEGKINEIEESEVTFALREVRRFRMAAYDKEADGNAMRLGAIMAYFVALGGSAFIFSRRQPTEEINRK